MLFAQAVLAAQACVAAVASPAMAIEQSDHDGHCGVVRNPGACLQHCTAGDQTIFQLQVAIPGMPAAPVLTVPVIGNPDGSPREPVVVLTRSPDPPRSIRFCSFQL
jgi:hypothetical protein